MVIKNHNKRPRTRGRNIPSVGAPKHMPVASVVSRETTPDARSVTTRSDDSKNHPMHDFRVVVPNYDRQLVDALPSTTVFRSGKIHLDIENYSNLTEEDHVDIAQWWDLSRHPKIPAVGHPWLATTRNIAEAYVIGRCMKECVDRGILNGLILDIGGSGIRHYEQRRPFIHSCNPDYTKAKGNACNQGVAQCLENCWPYEVGGEEFKAPVISFSIHSFYYLLAVDLMKAMQRTQLRIHYAVVHKYDMDVEENKAFYHSKGEMKWWRSGNTIISHAKGNVNQYIHPNPTWLFTSGQYVSKVGEYYVVIHAEQVAEFGEQLVFRMEMQVTTVEPSYPVNVPAPPNYTGPRETVSIKGTQYDKVLVDQANAWLLAVDRRKPASMKVFAAQFPQVFNRTHPSIGFPKENVSKALVDLYSAVNEEIRGLSDWATPEQKENLEELDRLRAGGLNVVSVCEPLPVAVTVATGVHLMLKRFSVANPWPFSIGSGLLAYAANMLRQLVSKGYSKFSHWKYLAGNWRMSVLQLLWRLLLKVRAYFSKPVSVVKTSDVCIPAPLKELHPEAIVRKPVETVCLPTRLQQCATFYIESTIPQRPRNCFHTIETAVHNRCAPVYEYESEWSVEMIPEWMIDGWKEVVALFRKYHDEDWYSRMPRHKQEKYQSDVRDFYLKSRSMYGTDVRQGFPKDEFSLNKEEISGRMIQACQSVYNEVVGPWLVGLSDAVAKVFNEQHEHLFYATKTTGEAVGHRIYLQSLLPGSWAKSDISRWDAHLHYSARKLERWFCEQAGFPSHVLDMMHALPLGKLVLRGGWSVKYRNGRFSGEPQTSVFNSLLISVVVSHVCNFLDKDIALTVLGDDAIVRFHGSEQLGLEFDGRVAEMFKRFGLNARFETCTLDELEFCSSLFYPNGGNLYMSWKLGRAAAKMQWDRKNLPFEQLIQWSSDVARGSRENASTVPVLRELFLNVESQFGGTGSRLEGWEEKILLEQEHVYDQQTLEFVARRYGVSVECVMEEAKRVRWAKFPLCLKGLFWERVSLVDNGGVLFSHTENLETYSWVPVARMNFLNAIFSSRVVDFFSAVCFAPVWEELFKKRFPFWGAYAIAMTESLGDWFVHGGTHFSFLFNVAFRCCFHMYTELFLSVHEAIAFHAGWNFVATLLSWRQPQAPRFALFVTLRRLLILASLQVNIKNLTDSDQAAMPRRRIRRARNRAASRALVVVNQPTRPKRTRVRRASGTRMHPYLVSRVNPFMAGVNGVRAPDEFGYPTGTAVIRVSSLMSADATGYSAKLYMPFLDPSVIIPLSTAAGTIVWAGGTTQTAPQNAALVNLASGYRTVAWGVRITADSSLTNSQGHIWVGHVPANLNSAFYNHAPTTEAQMSALPECEKFSVTNLAQHPIVVAGRPVDDGIYRFRSSNTLNVQSNVVESMTGWCNILIYMSGGIASTTALNVEYIMHIEYLQDGDSLYGFIDTIPGAYEPRLMERASKVDAMLPVGIVASAVETVEAVAGFSNRLVSAGARIMPLIGSAYQAAGMIRKASGYLRAPRSMPMIGWEDEKY